MPRKAGGPPPVECFAAESAEIGIILPLLPRPLRSLRQKLSLQKWKGVLVSENALHFDGDKPNSVSRLRGGTMIIYLARLAPDARGACAPRDATIPGDLCRTGCPSPVLSCTAWGFSCLAPCSVSGELLPRLFTFATSGCALVRPYFFCDTVRRGSLSRTAPPIFSGHAAVWCSDFPLAQPRGRSSDHLPSR